MNGGKQKKVEADRRSLCRSCVMCIPLAEESAVPYIVLCYLGLSFVLFLFPPGFLAMRRNDKESKSTAVPRD